MARENIIAKAVLRVGVGQLAATVKNGAKLVFVPLKACPKHQSAVGLDPHKDRAYCRLEGRECPLLQMVLSSSASIVCKGAESTNREDTPPTKR